MPYIVGFSTTFSALGMSAGVVNSAIKTTGSDSESVLLSLSSSEYRSVNYQIQVVRGENYNTTNVQVIHDNTRAYVSEYGTINQPVSISTFSSDLNGGNIRLLAYPSNSGLTTFKVIYTATKS